MKRTKIFLLMLSLTIAFSFAGAEKAVGYAEGENIVVKEIQQNFSLEGNTLPSLLDDGYSYTVSVYAKDGTTLIEENISAIANSLGLYDGTITIDDIFPLQAVISQRANIVGGIHTAGGKSYYNSPVAYYGGGLNLSVVEMDTPSSTDKVEVDLLSTYLNLQGSSSAGAFANMRGLMLKTVSSVTGFEPFAFHFVKDGYLYGETPNVSDLIENAGQAKIN